MTAVYMIVFSHEDYDGVNIVPSSEVTPRCVYNTIDGAELALKKLIENLSNFSPALYGEVYPFENTTASNEIAKKGHAVYGWFRESSDDEDDDEIIQYGVYINKVNII
jgi:hypothetical protein